MTFPVIDELDYYCRTCDELMVSTDCPAPNCAGARCEQCQAGCDIDLDTGNCFLALEQQGWAAREDRQAAPYGRRVRRPIRTLAVPGGEL